MRRAGGLEPLMKTLRAFAAVVVLQWAGTAAAASPQYAGSAGVGFDSNPGNAEISSKLPAEGYGILGLSADLLQPAAASTALLLRASVDGQQYFRHAGLSNARAALLLRGLYRPEGGFFMPTFALWGMAAAWPFHSHMRSGGEYRGGAYASEQITTGIRLRLGAYAAGRDARSDAFTLRSKAATFDADWLLSQRVTAHLGYEYRYGSFAVSSPADPGAAEFASARQTDDTLSSDGVSNIVYRLKGHAQLATVGLNYALTPALALDAQAQKIHTQSGFGDHYDRWLVELDLLAKF
jgi:hypothetical protein